MLLRCPAGFDSAARETYSRKLEISHGDYVEQAWNNWEKKRKFCLLIDFGAKIESEQVSSVIINFPAKS